MAPHPRIFDLMVFFQQFYKSCAGRDHLLALAGHRCWSPLSTSDVIPRAQRVSWSKVQLKEIEELGRHFQNFLNGAKIKTRVRMIIFYSRVWNFRWFLHCDTVAHVEERCFRC